MFWAYINSGDAVLFLRILYIFIKGMIMKKLIDEIIEFANDMNRHNAPAFSASVAFFFFMSLFPSLMFLFSLIRYIPITETDLLNLILDFCPNVLHGSVKGFVNELYSTSVSMMPIAALATLITAGVGIMGLIRGLNGVLDIEDTRNYFVIRGIATLYTMIMFVALIASMLLIGWGHLLYDKIVYFFPSTRGILQFVLRFRSLFVVLVLLVLFDMVYAFLPGKKQKLSLQLPGAFVSAVGWVVVTWAYGVYLDYFGGFSIYGSVLMIMFFLFWFYACFTILIFGAFLNKYYRRGIKRGYTKIKTYRKDNRDLKKAKRVDKEPEMAENK